MSAERKLIDDLLEYAVKYAELGDEPDNGACWEAVEAARAYLAQPATADSREESRAETLARLKSEGLTIGECITTLAVPNNDPYVTAARSLDIISDEVEIDDNTTTSVAEEGAWVLAWIWVSNEEADIYRHSELLEKVLGRARMRLAGPGIPDGYPAEDMADWLEDLIINYADELDEIETEVPKGAPGPITWVRVDGGAQRFTPSFALTQLRLLAKEAGLPDDVNDQVARFIEQHGNKLDTILTVIQVPEEA